MIFLHIVFFFLLNCMGLLLFLLKHISTKSLKTLTYFGTKKGFKPTENHLANNPQKLTEQVIVCENLASVCFIVHSAYKFNN